MPYTPTTWTAGVTAASQTNMNHLETQYTEASLSLGPDEAQEGYVLTGLTVTKTGAAQVTMAAGTVYVEQTDGTTRRYTFSSTPETTTSPNTTFFLDIKPDGTINWATTHSGVNYVTIASVTTDGSSNVVTVTDTRPQLIRWLGSATGFSAQLPPQSVVLGASVALPVVTGMSGSAIAGAGMGTGIFKYAVTYAFDGGETLASATVSATTTGGNNQVSLTGIPTSSDPRVTMRKIYRSLVGASTPLYWIATIGDNATTTYTDTAGDSAVTGGKQTPSRPSVGGTLRGGYPWSTSTPNSAYGGTAVNSPTFGVSGLVTGDATTCVTLSNASANYVTGPGNGLANGNAPWSICGLFKFGANPGSNRFIMSFGTTASKTGGRLFIDTAGKLNGDVNGTGAIVSGSAAALNVPHHAALTWDGTTLRLILDGVSQGTTTPGALSVPVTPTIYIGASQTPNLQWSGQLQEAAFYNYLLSPVQIAKQSALVSGASGAVSYATQVADDGPVRWYRLGDAVGSGIAAESSRYETVITSDGQVKAALPVSLDRGLITTDGAGSLSTNGGLVFTDSNGILHVARDATIANQEMIELRSIGGGGHQFGININTDNSLSIFDFTSSLTLFKLDGATGVIKTLANLALAAYGVPVVIAQARDVSVTGTTLTVIATVTTPNDGKNHLVRVHETFSVGSGNTNSGTITQSYDYTEPLIGAVTDRAFTLFDGSSMQNIASLTWAKGLGYSDQVFSRVFMATPNSTINIKYRNAAAGTISDKVSGLIEILT